ncbi:hypothetical protein WCP94_000855 [Bilophila wadsworthia]
MKAPAKRRPEPLLISHKRKTSPHMKEGFHSRCNRKQGFDKAENL